MMTDLRTKAAVQIQQGLETNLEQTAGVEDKLNGQLRQLVGAAGSAVPKMQRASDLATDITRLQARYTDVDSQLHDLLLEDGAPGSVFLETAAVPPLHAAKSSVLRNAILMMGFFMVLGLVAAVAAHKLDPRVYTGSDVEQLLGFAPMAQLPDFMEVPDQVADEQLLRLASSIEYARKQGNLKSCIFTGAASGAGVTTLATRVRDMLEAMGRPTVLVDASGIPAPPPRASLGAQAATGHTTAQLGSRSTALLQQVADEARLEESLVLTDTAPVAISAETEYLARFVDCAIVVIESGVTTREQLRAAAQALRKVDVATVGFVLNRVAIAKADPEYRNSVSAVESHLRYQSRSSGRHTVRSRHYATEEAASVATPAREAAVPRAHEPAPQPAAPRQAEPQWAPQWATPQGDAQASAVPPAPRMPQAQMAAQSVPQPESEMPWWLSDARPQRETAATAASRPAEEDTSLISESRLSGLRDVLFSLGLNNLNKSHEAELHEEAAIPIPVPVREREPERPYYGQAFVPYPEPEQETVRATPTHVIAAPEFLPPRETIGAQGKRRSWEESSVTARRDRRDTVDEVTILPSWRGQYRKKD
jgi:Mrp family chromosome partitioning ATPase